MIERKQFRLVVLNVTSHLSSHSTILCRSNIECHKPSVAHSTILRRSNIECHKPSVAHSTILHRSNIGCHKPSVTHSIILCRSNVECHKPTHHLIPQYYAGGIELKVSHYLQYLIPFLSLKSGSTLLIITLGIKVGQHF